TLLLVFSFIFFFIITPPPPTSTLFPYTTLFRSPPIGLSQRRFMMLAVIPFPNIDPVLFSIGPFAVRWYALAYIVGILGGWFYARTIVRSQTLWGGPAPLTVTDYDDFILWVTLGIILGGRTGYVLFYNAPYFVEHPLEIF